MDQRSNKHEGPSLPAGHFFILATRQIFLCSTLAAGLVLDVILSSQSPKRKTLMADAICTAAHICCHGENLIPLVDGTMENPERLFP